jgi:hypothetical protein
VWKSMLIRAELRHGAIFDRRDFPKLNVQSMLMPFAPAVHPLTVKQDPFDSWIYFQSRRLRSDLVLLDTKSHGIGLPCRLSSAS